MIFYSVGQRVFRVTSKYGVGRLTYDEGRSMCEQRGASIASLRQLQTAVLLGFESCECGWVHGARVFYAFQYGWPGCGNARAGPDVVDCMNPPRDVGVNPNYDAYCFDPSESEYEEIEQ